MSNQSPTPNERVLPTMNKDGTRRWIHPKLSTGKLYKQRKWVAYTLMLIFVLLPFLRWNGKHLFLLDLTARRFTIFGFTFFPTDTLLLWLSMLTLGLSVFLFTALFGRVWCGWACPQTVYMEFLFRPIEHWLEGPPAQRQKRDQQGFFAPIRLLKYAIFLAIAAILANSFLAYFVSPEVLWSWMRESPYKHPTPFLVMLVTTFLIFFDFAYFREQTCLVACPYGRIQSVLLDRNSLIVGYDLNRGEPRGRAAQRKATPPTPATSSDTSAPANKPSSTQPTSLSATIASAQQWGDCIDCGACVITCPTGIDIREGLQMECINCTQCIDACDAIMTKINKPTGLIRYASQAELDGGPRLQLKRPRTLIYSTLIFLLFSVLAFAMTRTSRTSAQASLLRAGSEPYQLLDDGTISNHLHVRVANRTSSKQHYRIEVFGPKDRPLRTVIPINPIEVDAYGLNKANLFMMVPRTAHDKGAYTVKIRVSDGKDFTWERTFPLMGPTRRTTPPSTHPTAPNLRPTAPITPNTRSTAPIVPNTRPTAPIAPSTRPTLPAPAMPNAPNIRPLGTTTRPASLPNAQPNR